MKQIYFPEGTKLQDTENIRAVCSMEQLKLAAKRRQDFRGCCCLLHRRTRPHR